MRREKHDDVNKKNENKEGKSEPDTNIVGRFPDVDTDERLKVASSTVLPDVPQVNIKRPISEAAGTKVSSGNTVAQFRGMGLGYTIGIVLVTSILTGTGLGWLVDKYLLHSPVTPWGLIVGFFAGTVTGFVQMISITNRINAEEDAASRASGKGVR